MEPSPPWTGPSRAKLLVRGLTARCPVCGDGRIVQGWFRLRERCRRCGLRVHRQEGQWSGDIGVNTIVTFTLLFAVLLGGTLAMGDDLDVARLVGACLFVTLVFPVLFVPVAKTLWLAVDLAMRAPTADEVDAAYRAGS